MLSYEFFAVCPKGLEQVLEQELQALSVSQIKSQPGGAYFNGSLETLYLANIWLRTASRVMVTLREFSAQNPAMLYDQVRRVAWEKLIPNDLTFAIESHLSGPQPEAFRSAIFLSQKIKDAICDRIRHENHNDLRPNVDRNDPDVRVDAYFRDGRCTLSLDSSGRSLHERGYRRGDTGAPLKENLAAGIILSSGYNPETEPFLDPMCGSGTFLIEAALIACEIAPGLLNPKFGFQRWPNYQPQVFDRLLHEARARVRVRSTFPILGFDDDAHAIRLAERHLQAVHLDSVVQVRPGTLDTLKVSSLKPGTLIVNPPYAARMGTEEEMGPLYKELGDFFKKKLLGWKCHVFTGSAVGMKSVGLRTSFRKPLFNGPIECRLLRYEIR